ncbi:hypothetical protein LTR86_005081 [Recurvomyces mirabilis]|nr:hypothetical protein LTR86_005081 [Recurvomyces mirabilis]
MPAHNDQNTILLAEHEVHGIRTGVQAWLERRREVAGTKRQPQDKAMAVREATGASLMLDMGAAPDPDLVGRPSGQPLKPLIVLDRPYAPCASDVTALKPVRLTELRMETHHRGFYLEARRVSPVVSLAIRSWIVVQDEDGEVERLEVYLHTGVDDGNILESASGFFIKEPYLTINREGHTVLRVDHSTDLIAYKPNGEAYDDYPGPSRADSPNEDTAGTEDVILWLKGKGNAALKRRDLHSALTLYSNALATSSDSRGAVSSSLTNAILRNRAHVNLLTGRFEQAKIDALASLAAASNELDEHLNATAYFRAGCAAYRLGQFEEATQLFTEQQSLTPDDREADLYLRRTALRLKEQATGVYGFGRLRSKYQGAAESVDAADYVVQTVVRDSAGKGRGCFVKHDLATGSVVICEKAFCVARPSCGQVTTALTYDTRDEQIHVSPVSLVKVLAERLVKNPGCIAKIMELVGGRVKDTGMPVVDTFRLHDIVRYNAFAVPQNDGQSKEASTGLWGHAAMINHSCIPNIEPEFIGDLIIFRATRPIKAGEEVLHCYDATRDYSTRRTALKTTWEFECGCVLCMAESADDLEVRKRREELANKADDFVQRMSIPAKRLAIVKARRFAKAINATYHEGRYVGIPRTAAKAIEAWLAAAIA